jgi:hypothetical protein
MTHHTVPGDAKASLHSPAGCRTGAGWVGYVFFQPDATSLRWIADLKLLAE